MSDLLMSVENVSVWYPVHGGILGRVQNWVKAVRNISFGVNRGEIVAIVGESGCGKSTLAHSLVGLRDLREGNIHWNGNEPPRSRMQLVFQDPFSSLNPRQTLEEIVCGPLIANGIRATEAKERGVRALEQVGLSGADLHKYPHAFSGGQRQRIGIARALALEAKLLICDEPTSALDVSVQAQILQLLQQLRDTLGLSILIISHDLSVISALADRVLVMYLGSIVEEISAKRLVVDAGHPYTRALLEAVPTLDVNRKPVVLEGEIPSLTNLPSGCVFAGRCPIAREICLMQEPGFMDLGRGHIVRCPFSQKMG